MNEVIAFPKDKIIRENTQNIDLLEKAKSNSVKRFADDVSETLASICYDQIETFGLNTTDDSFDKDFSFLVNVLTATVYRTLKIDHDLHKFVDEHVTVDEETEDKTEEIEQVT